MSTRWETLIGGTDRFALKIAFADDASSVNLEPDYASSWGSFEIWVNGSNLCAHIEEGEVVSAVHWYLLPLLEWITCNWNPFLHEERLPIRNAGRDAVESLYQTRFAAPGLSQEAAAKHDGDWYAWRERHALHAAREGGLFPEIYFRRWEDQIEVSWSNDAPAGTPDGFAFLATSGRALLDPDDVAVPLFSVMRAAVDRLLDWHPDSSRIQALRNTLADLNKQGRQRIARLDWLFEFAAARTGDATAWDQVRGLFRGTSAKVRRAVLEPDRTSGLVLRGSSHAVLLFGTVDPDIDISDARTLAQHLIAAYDESGDPAMLLSLVEEVTNEPRGGLPWEQGYDIANSVLGALDGVARAPIDDTLGSLDVQIESVDLADARIRGVAIAGPQHHPRVLVNESHPRNQSPEGRRFTLAHELCHLIVDRRFGRRLAVATGPWAPIEVEQRANAFAAYFLMPVDEVRSAIAKLTYPLASVDGIREIAREFGTSPRATLEHLHNLGFVDTFQRNLLRGSSLPNDAFAQDLGTDD